MIMCINTTYTMHCMRILLSLFSLTGVYSTPNTFISEAISEPTIEFNILLKQQNIDVLERELIERSSPTSSNYGQWLSKEDIDTIIQPKPYQSLLDWFGTTHIRCTNHVDNLQCTGTYSDINTLFQTKLGTHIDLDIFQSDNIGNHYEEIQEHYGYIIPTHLQSHIDFIIGLTDVPKYVSNIKVEPLKIKPVFDNRSYISPESIRQLYNISTYNDSIYSSQAVVEFLNDSCYSNNDLQTFLQDNNKPNITVELDPNLVNCDPTQTISPDIEASLDIQYQVGIHNNTHQKYVSIDDWMYQFANKLYMSKDPPKVNSMSWGWAEWDQCDPSVMPQCALNITSEQYAGRTNTEFIKVGLRGITLLASSGDAGAPGRTNEECDGSRPLNPVFPTSSPWVLSVGGTIILNATPIDDPQTQLCKNNTCIGSGIELNCNIDRCGWTSGGGFSDYFKRPTWQVPGATHYVKTAKFLPPSKYFNADGRIYPDISLVSHNFLIKTGGVYGSVDGTSASSPSVSAMMSILNNLQISNNKATLGPVAPLLYDMYTKCDHCFKDISVGSNNSTEDSRCTYGYHAIEGFDAVYGLGVPNFDAIYEYVKHM